MPTVEQLEKLLASEPNDPFLNFGLAMALDKAGRRDEALARFDRTLEFDSDYVPAYFQKARVQADAGKMGNARETLNQGIETARRVGDTHAEGEMSEFLATLE